MKNRMQDVRNHIVAMMEALADKEVSAEVIERAKATSMLGSCYVQSVRVELDALKLYDETSLIPKVLDGTPELKLVSGGR